MQDGRSRVVIEGILPQIDGGFYAIRRIAGDVVQVAADIFADGPEMISAVILSKQVRAEPAGTWTENAMVAGRNDRWQGVFTVPTPGTYVFTIEAWIDHVQTWRRDLEKKLAAGQNVHHEIAALRQAVARALEHARKYALEDAPVLDRVLEALSVEPSSCASITNHLGQDFAGLMRKHGNRPFPTRYARELRVEVNRSLARFGAWYEFFPRSTASQDGHHGTLRDSEPWLEHVAKMGFDVVYFPPIHPVGRSFRKGRNNSLKADPDDPGSPWAIGGAEGGHKAIHPELGTFADFDRLVRKARELGLEIAMDIAFQCSPDHPYVSAHPEWFKKRMDGSIQYAENPPKKYQDIYPFDFECPAWEALWHELKSVFEFWINRGIRIFRVDNPHTKSFRFWEWCLSELKLQHPDLIFLSEAFTRPKVMFFLAKIGFTQSYNYFPWRNSKAELTQYFTELSQTPVSEFFTPSLWPNTPDILTAYLKFNGRAGFMIRLILAATLGPSYGIYGPAFETCEHQSPEPETEEYLNSEKYEIRHWPLGGPDSLAPLMTKLNRIRRAQPAFKFLQPLQFLEVDNDSVIAYAKAAPGNTDRIIVVVNLDPRYRQSGRINLPLDDWGFALSETYQMHDLLTDAHYLWTGARNYVELDPNFAPAHIFHVRRHVRTEHDFDYFV